MPLRDMNQAQRFFQDHAVELGVEKANLVVWQMRSKLSQPEWRDAVQSLRSSSVFDTLQTDPYTRRAFTRPRGYAGDATMLDYLYRLHPEDTDDELDEKAWRIFLYTVNSNAGKAVRYRRTYLAQLIDETGANHHNARVLSIAAGHLREVELSAAVQEGKVSEIVALDQDAESLKRIEQDYSHLPIRTVQASVRHLLAGKAGMGHFHFVYAAGLFDYLEDSVATRLVERMWAMTHPGGRMMIANFLPDIPDAGYMEAFMDWWLIYRDEEQARKLFSTIAPAQIASMKVEFDPGKNICFVVAQKAGA